MRSEKFPDIISYLKEKVPKVTQKLKKKIPNYLQNHSKNRIFAAELQNTVYALQEVHKSYRRVPTKGTTEDYAGKWSQADWKVVSYTLCRQENVQELR